MSLIEIGSIGKEHDLEINCIPNNMEKYMKQKGVYPYDYMDSVERFNDKQLPSKADFYSILTDEGITDL